MNLNSFIISNTPFQQVRWWTEDMTKEQFTKFHVFQKEDMKTYIERLLTTAASANQITVEA